MTSICSSFLPAAKLLETVNSQRLKFRKVPKPQDWLIDIVERIGNARSLMDGKCVQTLMKFTNLPG